MNITIMAVASVAIFTMLVLACSPRFACFARGYHKWSRPWTETKRRIHRCDHCGIVRDYVNTPLTVPVIDQREIDGSGWRYAPAKEAVENKVVVPIGRKKA